jgi:hypothetical protein
MILHFTVRESRSMPDSLFRNPLQFITIEGGFLFVAQVVRLAV